MARYWFRLISLTALKHPSLNHLVHLLPRLQNLIAAFSTTRRVIRLGHAVESFEAFWTFAKDPAPLFKPDGEQRLLARLAFFQSILSIFNDISDDIVCFGRIGFLDKSYETSWAPVSARLWFTNILIDLNQNRSDARALSRTISAADPAKEDVVDLKDRRYWLELSMWKLLADLAFCAVDVWPKAKVFADGTGDVVQAWGALASAVLGGLKGVNWMLLRA